ncbi:MAG: hypothetical protein WBG57_02100 [Ornithinimicrobium sp.]
MSGPGFVPVRQLVLVDLLSLIVSVHPGERSVVAIDGINAVSRRQVVAEVLALAAHVSGRNISAASTDDFRRAGVQHPRAARSADVMGNVGADRSGDAYYRRGFDYETFVDDVVKPFRAGPGDAMLLIDGVFLHRPELVSRWDASVFVRGSEHGAYPFSAYLDQSPDLQATWVLDDTAPAAPRLTYGAVVEPRT